MSFPTVALGDIFEIARGGSPRPIENYLTDDPGGLNWVLIGDATRSGKYIHSTEKRIKPEGLKKTRAVEPGDFLLSNSMSFGRPYIMATHGCIHDGWLLLRNGGKHADPDYLYHLLGSKPVYREFVKRAPGTTVKNLNTGIVSETRIPLPPLKEQKRIAAILDQADGLRRQRIAAQSRLIDFPIAKLGEMIGIGGTPPVNTRKMVVDPPANCRWVTLTDVARLATGHTPDRKIDDYWDGSIPWISLSDIRALDGRVATRTSECVTKAGIANSSSVILPEGTVCLARTASVGFATMMGREMATSQDFVNWVCGPDLEPIYLLYALIASRRELRSLAPGSTHKTIYFPTVKAFKILLPPLAIQKSFADAVRTFWDVQRTMNDDLNRIDSLFTSLQHRAFRGEL